jgi:hypothetical protein
MCEFGKVAYRRLIIGHLGFSEMIGCKSKQFGLRQSDTSGRFSCIEVLRLDMISALSKRHHSLMMQHQRVAQKMN